MAQLNNLSFVTIASILLFMVLLYQFLSSPLCTVPGPFLARITRLWYLFKVRSGHLEKEMIDLHAKHGKVVRLAPNVYSFDDPAAIKTIYGRASNFRKSNYYTAFEVSGISNVFTMRQIDQHAQERKKFHPAYTMTSMTAYEGYVDECVQMLTQRLREMAEADSIVDMAKWFQFFAFDVIGFTTFSKRFGFLDTGEDQSELIYNLHKGFAYASQVGIYHEFHQVILSGLGFLAKLGVIDAVSRQYLLRFVKQRLEERKPEVEKLATTTTGPSELSRTPTLDDQEGPKDFVTRFIEYHQKDPEHFMLGDVLRGTMANVNAGSDTTSSTLTAILYYLVANPEKLARLRAEIDDHMQAGTLSDPATFKEAQGMEYLQAVIKEAMRLHPAVGVPLERVVPNGGASISGYDFPAGTVVGINAWVAHHNTDVFCPDADAFRPERWLRNETDGETLAKMEHYYMPFGLGSRTCLGRNVAMLEMVKAIPQIIRTLDFEIGDELKCAGELTSTNHFLVMPKSFYLLVRFRKESL